VGIKANYTYTYSRIRTSKSKRVRDENDNLKTISVSETRPLYNQPSHIANLALLYSDAATGSEAQLVGAYSSRRIYTVSQFAGDDIWQRGSVQLDASVEKRIRSGWSVFAKVRNILNTPMVLYIDNNSDKNSAVPHQDLPGKTLIRRDYFQRSVVLGIRYTPGL
jgi:outer membrane receptor protein involved in Fe transport